MPPADPAALRDALATVREYEAGAAAQWPISSLDPTDEQSAFELIARAFLSLLDAGELVRVRGSQDRLSLGETGRTAYYLSDRSSRSWPFVAEAVLAAALEPLLPEVRT